MEDFQFQYDTFQLIATVRAYCFLDFTGELEKGLIEMKRSYEAEYPAPRYTLLFDLSRFHLRRANKVEFLPTEDASV